MRSSESEVQSAKNKVQSEDTLHVERCTLNSALTCPVCEQRFRESDDGVVMPFCSRRCKMIDAARWLDERYGLPVEKQLESEYESEHEA